METVEVTEDFRPSSPPFSSSIECCCCIEIRGRGTGAAADREEADDVEWVEGES